MTGSPWIAERSLSPDEAGALVADRFPELAGAAVRAFGEGWDNSAFLVDETWVFRFPRREVAVGLLKSEIAVLPAIAGALSLAIPVPEWVGEPTAGFPWPFAGYRLIPGTTACAAAPDPESRARSAPLLGRFLRELHGIPAAAARDAGAPPDRFERLHPDRRRRFAEDLARLAESGDPSPGEVSAHRALAEAVPPDWRPGAVTLVHGDLYSRHLVVDAGAVVTGVIDWGDLHLGDPAIDLSVAFGFLPPEARPAFWSEYGEPSPATATVARFHAACHAVKELLYARDVGDRALYREARTSLDRSVEP